MFSMASFPLYVMNVFRALLYTVRMWFRRPSGLNLYYRIQIMRPDGTVRLDGGIKRGHSFVLQFLKQFQYLFRHTSISGVTDTGGTTRSVSTTLWDNGVFSVTIAGVGVSTYGIVVGSGTNAEDNTDIALQTKIGHGSGAGQLQYGPHFYRSTRIVGINVDFQMQRSFVNASGGSVTINEIGIYGLTSYYFCLIRDIVGALVLADGEVALVTYIIRTTV